MSQEDDLEEYGLADEQDLARSMNVMANVKTIETKKDLPAGRPLSWEDVIALAQMH
jgi:hypothetical protein